MMWTRVRSGLYQSLDEALRVWKIERTEDKRWEVRAEGLHVVTRNTLKEAQRSAEVYKKAVAARERRAARE